MGLYYVIGNDNLFSLDLGGSGFVSYNGDRSGSSPIGTYTVDNSFGGGFLEGRVLLNLKQWKPYMQMHYGVINCKTEESVQDVSSKLFSESSINHGVGLGILYEASDDFYIDFGVMYNRGGSVNFLDLNSFSSKGNVIDYNVNSASSDMLIFKLGIAFYIDQFAGSSSTSSYSSNSTPYYDNGNRNNCNTSSPPSYDRTPTIIHHGKTPVGISR